jgi:uncharacterized protein (TIGR03066 family)
MGVAPTLDRHWGKFMRAVLYWAVLVALSDKAGAEDKGPAPIDGKLVVGRWKYKGADDDALVFEFTKAGMLVARDADSTVVSVPTSYTVAGRTVALTRKGGDQEKTEILRISALTATEMVFSVGPGREKTFVRIKDK